MAEKAQLQHFQSQPLRLSFPNFIAYNRNFSRIHNEKKRKMKKGSNGHFGEGHCILHLFFLSASLFQLVRRKRKGKSFISPKFGWEKESGNKKLENFIEIWQKNIV